ncbi:GMP/IMP nucleotidase YrfG [Nymphon striatum]|nr:GMP/IMP nucleotidase YrfG [Nymphon striatum]
MDGTLLDLHFDNHFWLEHMPKRYAEKHSISMEKASELLLENYKSHEGSLKWYCLDHWEESLEMDIVSLKHEVADRIAIRDNVIEFLDYLNNLGKRVVLLTNAHRKTVNLKFEYVEIKNHFDRIITSHDVGFAKEQNGFWDEMHKVEDFEPVHSLFIDDNLDVLNAAKAHGVAHLLAIHQPDSKQSAKDTKDYTAVECYTQLMA